MFTDTIKDLNKKSLTLAVLAVFVFVFISDWLIHGLILVDMYKASATLWRDDEAMGAHFGWMLLGQFLIAKFFTILFAYGYKGRGIAEGVRFGFLVGMFNSGMGFINYAISPISAKLAGAWIVLGIVQSVLAGCVAASVYKKK